MKSLDFGRYLFSAGAIGALLTGCGGSQPPTGPQGMISQGRAVTVPRTNSNTADADHSYRVLYSFVWGTSDGSNPAAGLIDVKGMLYGTTANGGGGCNSYGPGCGTVYSIDTTGIEKVLHGFHHHRKGLYTDEPLAGLLNVKGMLYGTTAGGGDRKGTVFGISTTGRLKILHVFAAGCGYDDGFVPQGRLIDVDGTLYGTTYFGGSCKARGDGLGTVYSVTLTGQERVVYRFKGGSDGANPQAGLIEVNRTLYGTTVEGGNSGCFGHGCGTVYSISPIGKERVLHRFQDSPDGATPRAGLIDVLGTLYGTTASGGSKYAGTVYAMTTTGKERVIYSFRGGMDGSEPEAGLIDAGGTLYGTTYYGCLSYSSPGCGTVFSVSTTGDETLLHHFAGKSDGADPSAALVNVKGTLYGTTSEGGSGGGGTVFALTP